MHRKDKSSRCRGGWDACEEVTVGSWTTRKPQSDGYYPMVGGWVNFTIENNAHKWSGGGRKEAGRNPSAMQGRFSTGERLSPSCSVKVVKIDKI